MNIEVLKKNDKKKIIVLITLILSTFITILCGISFAKYRSSKSISIAKGTINYSPADLSIMAIYIENDDGNYTKVTDGKIPSSGYKLNTDNIKTRCEINGVIDNNVKLTYENGEIEVSRITNSGTKCYFYFDKKPILSNKIPEGKPTDDNMFAGIEGDGIYTWIKGDYSGGSQSIKYYRGNVNNNWVVFGKDGSYYIWWRIIRNNSNGSLRMIYAGLSSSKTSAPATTGEGTQIGTSAFNSSYNDNMYVGFKYTSGDAHGTGTASTILGPLNSWYNRTLANNTDYSNKIDIDAGFCNDRTPISGTGIGTTNTYYAAYNRLHTNKAPSLLCTNTNDIFKTPLGLITTDEIAMGGMVNNTSKTNKTTYLYTNRNYWTMTPSYTINGGYAYVIYVNSSGNFVFAHVGNTMAPIDVRPVINLKADTLIEQGTGTSTDPYIVQGT